MLLLLSTRYDPRTLRITGRQTMNSVLVVDDDADSREAVSRFLSKSGYTVRSAPNGRAALMSLLSIEPDVVILDLRMPEMDGIQLLEVMRSYLRLSTLPTIVLSAYTEDADVTERLKNLGVKHVFSKADYSLESLRNCVRQLMADPKTDCG